MAAPSPKEVAIRWFEEVWNKRNAGAIRDLLAPDALGHLEGGSEIVGPDPFIKFQQLLLDALPDLRVEIVNSLSDGDDACILWDARATHSGQSMGLTPTGKSVSFRGITWFRVIDGKIIEGWDCWNQAALFSTLSGKPDPEET